MPKVILTITTSLHETYEMSCECTDINAIYSLEARPIVLKEQPFKKNKMASFTNRSFSVSGAFHGKLNECFPELNKTNEL